MWGTCTTSVNIIMTKCLTDNNGVYGMFKFLLVGWLYRCSSCQTNSRLYFLKITKRQTNNTQHYDVSMFYTLHTMHKPKSIAFSMGFFSVWFLSHFFWSVIFILHAVNEIMESTEKETSIKGIKSYF